MYNDPKRYKQKLTITDNIREIINQARGLYGKESDRGLIFFHTDWASALAGLINDLLYDFFYFP